MTAHRRHGHSAHGNWVVSAGDDGTVRVWEWATGQELQVLEGHDGRGSQRRRSHGQAPWRGGRDHQAHQPHSLRHSFITAALDAGVPLRDVQEAASHADPRTTMRYDRGRGSLDRHAAYIMATFLAGASR